MRNVAVYPVSSEELLEELQSIYNKLAAEERIGGLDLLIMSSVISFLENNHVARMKLLENINP